VVGLTARRAKSVLADRGLHWHITYKTTSGSAAGTIISQSKQAGGEVRPGATITLVIAKAPPVTAPPTTNRHLHPRAIATPPIPTTAFLRHRLIWIAPTSATASKLIIGTATRITWMLTAMASAATAGDDK
jgi:PASTA domain